MDKQDSGQMYVAQRPGNTEEYTHPEHGKIPGELLCEGLGKFL